MVVVLCNYGAGYFGLGPERDGARADKMKLKQKLYQTNTTSSGS